MLQVHLGITTLLCTIWKTLILRLAKYIKFNSFMKWLVFLKINYKWAWDDGKCILKCKDRGNELAQLNVQYWRY